MQVQLSGVLASQPSQQSQRGDDAMARAFEVNWICRVCGKENSVGDEDDRSDRERCKCCGRDRDPVWLWLQKYELQVRIKTLFRLPDDAAFGTRVGIISGIDFFRQRTQVLAISSRTVAHDVARGQQVGSAKCYRSRFRFETLEFDASQLQQLVPASTETTDQVQELIAALKHHGLCGDCRRVFRIAQGDAAQENTNREAIDTLHDELQRLVDLKKQNIKLREYDRVLEHTRSIQSMRRQLAHQKRTVEFLSSLSCPHCGWTALRETQTNILK
jgi:hypothetical protein